MLHCFFHNDSNSVGKHTTSGKCIGDSLGFFLLACIFLVNRINWLVPFSSHFFMTEPVLCLPSYHCQNRKRFFVLFRCVRYCLLDSLNTIDKIQSSYSSLILLIAAAMVPVTPFQPLCDGGYPDPSEWCIPNRVRDNLTICRGLRHLISDGLNLVTSACHSEFCWGFSICVSKSLALTCFVYFRVLPVIC